jgi:hypothetical protein
MINPRWVDPANVTAAKVMYERRTIPGVGQIGEDRTVPQFAGAVISKPN